MIFRFEPGGRGGVFQTPSKWTRNIGQSALLPGYLIKLFFPPCGEIRWPRRRKFIRRNLKGVQHGRTGNSF